MRHGFPGFPLDTLKFFRSLKRNNTREWFQPRKHIYEEQIRAPMMELVAAINERLMRFAPRYVTEPKKAIYRIYRDTRFSKDKTPYKTHIAALLTRQGLGKDCGAGLYFAIEADGVQVAGGAYHPRPPTLLALRQHIAANHAAFRRTLVGPLSGEKLTRVPKGFDANHPAAEWLRFKNFVLHVKLDADLITSPRLLDEIVGNFRAMAPFVEFLDAALTPKRRPEILD